MRSSIWRTFIGDRVDCAVSAEAQQAARALWFANLNTPEEFAEAVRHSDALDKA
jgi:molybdopterin-guanine dinucleotide biosynthesis protein A